MIDQVVKQKKIFTDGEGDSWFDRNSKINMEDRISKDLILKELDRLNFSGTSCLEIGCAEGWRLAEIRSRYSWQCFGIEPSIKAIMKGSRKYDNINLVQGTADSLPYADQSMSVVIVGFCLYLCDRDELFKISSEIDRVLIDGGLIVILDFYSEIPYRNSYSHLDGVYSYKMDYSKLFLWNPAYQLLSKIVSSHKFETVVKDKDERVMMCSLRKSLLDAYSESPNYNYE